MVSMTALTTVFDVRRYRKSGMYSTFVLMRALWVLDTREKNQVRTGGVTWGQYKYMLGVLNVSMLFILMFD